MLYNNNTTHFHSKRMYYFPYQPCFIIAPISLPTPFTSHLDPSGLITADGNNTAPQTPSTPTLTKEPSFSQTSLAQNPRFTSVPSIPERKRVLSVKDEEYRPDRPASKKKGKMKQIEGRNIIPNVIRLIVSFIQKKGKSEKVVDRLFAKSKVEEGWSPKRYYHYQSMVKNHLNNYVREETLGELVKVRFELSSIYGEEQQRFYNGLTRVMIGQFMREDFFLYLLTSKRLDRTKIYDHLAALRTLRGKLRKILLRSHSPNQ